MTTEVQNLGQADAGPFLVRFLLTGQGGSINDAIFLGDATIPGLAAGYNQRLTQTLQLPSRLPAGVTLGNVGYARIAVIVDPENIDQRVALQQQRLALRSVHCAAPRQRDHGADHGDGWNAALGADPGPAIPAAGQARRRRRTRGQDPGAKRQPNHRRSSTENAAKSGQNIAKITVNVGRGITKLPTQVFDEIKKSL